MESIRRPVPALAPRPFWFLAALAAGAALLLAAPPSPAQQTEPPPATTAISTIALSVDKTSVTESGNDIGMIVTVTDND